MLERCFCFSILFASLVGVSPDNLMIFEGLAGTTVKGFLLEEIPTTLFSPSPCSPFKALWEVLKLMVRGVLFPFTSLIPLAAERGHQHQHYCYFCDCIRITGCSSAPG